MRMKNLRKPLSVFLAVLMLMSVFSAGFMGYAYTTSEINAINTAFGRSPGITNATWNNAANATTVSGNHNVWLAAEAYYAAARSTAKINNAGSRDNVTANNTVTKVSATLEAAITTNKSYAKRFAGNPIGYEDSALENTNPSAKNTTFKVSRDAKSTLLSYSSIANIPTGNVPLTRVYTWVHAVKVEEWKTGPWYNKKTHKARWHYLTAINQADSNNVNFSTVKNAMNDYKSYFTSTLMNASLASLSASQLTNRLNTANTKKTALLNALSGVGLSLDNDIVNKFSLPATATVNTYIDNLQFYVNVNLYSPYVRYFNDATTGVCNTYPDSRINAETNVTTLKSLRSTSTEKFNALNVVRTNSSLARVRTTLQNEYGLNFTAIDHFRATLEHRIQLLDLVALKAEIDSYIVAYADYRNFSDAALNAAISRFNGYKNSLRNNFNSAYVAEVFTSGIGYVDDFYFDLAYERTLRGEQAIYSNFHEYFIPKFTVDLTRIATNDLIALANTERTKQDELNAAYNNAASQLTAEDLALVYGSLRDDVTVYIDSIYKELEARIASQVEDAMALYNEYGTINLENYTTVKTAIDRISVDTYNLLLNLNYNGTRYMSAQTRSDYTRLKNAILAQYNSFVGQQTFARWHRNDLASQYPTRVPNDAQDYARSTTAGKNYVVNEAKLNNLIATLDDFIRSEDFADLLKLEENTLDEFLYNVIADKLYTDEIVNALVGILYPELVKMFNDLYNGLPATYNVNVVGTLTLSYKALPTIISDLGLAVHPNALSSKISGSFATAKAQLTAAGTNWDNLRNADGKVEIDWGINSITDPNARKERFTAALSESFNGILPVLRILLCNYGSYRGVSEKAGKASKKVLGISVSLNADAILTARACHGYINTVAPILEALGCTNIKTAEQIQNCTTSRQIVEAILNPIYTLVDQLCHGPLDKLCSILPNVALAMSGDLIFPLLDNLNTNLHYLVEDSILGINVLQGDYPLNAGELIDPASLSIDITDMNSILNDLVSDMVGTPTFELPIINAGLLSSLGSLTQKSSVRNVAMNGLAAGRRYDVVADRADVLFYLLGYIVDALGDELFVRDLLGGLNNDPEYNLPDILKQISNGLADDNDGWTKGDAVAALLELFVPQNYNTTAMQWRETTNPLNLTAADIIYLRYSNYWTRDKAKYVDENINTLVNNVLEMAGSERDINTMLTEMFNGLFTTKLLDDISGFFAGLSSSLGGNELVLNLLNEQFGIDVTAWDRYRVEDPANPGEYLPYDWGFEDGDRAAFVNALVEILRPAANLLTFVLAGRDISIFVGRSGADLVTFKGYNGYAEGLIPLMEALGCDNILTTAQYAAAVNADATRVITAITDPLFARIDEIFADPLAEVINVLPDLLYYIDCGGLVATVRNLLQSVFVLVDTVRPIYNVNLDELINIDNLLGRTEENSLGGISITNLTLESIFLIIEGLTDNLNESGSGLELSPYLTSAFRSIYVGNTESFTSANGKTAYRLKYAPAEGLPLSEGLTRADVLTVMISTLVEIALYNQNLEVIEQIAQVDGLASVVRNLVSGNEAQYQKIDWLYFDEHAGIVDVDENTSLVLPERSIVYITYPNNWTYETADYAQQNLTDIVDLLIKSTSDAQSLAELTQDIGLYTDKNVVAIALKLKELTAQVDATLLEAVGVILDVDVAHAWDAYTEDTVLGITDRASFVEALIDVFSPVNAVLEWLLLGDNYAFLVGDQYTGVEGRDLITIAGANGYAEGLIPLMEALGCENILTPDEMTLACAADADNLLRNILNPILARLDAILANPIDEVIDLLPNLVYFINANGLTVSIYNTIAAVNNILETIAPLQEVNLDELVGLPISNLNMSGICSIINDKLGIDIEGATNGFLNNLYVGQLEYFESQNGKGAMRMVYSAEEDRADALTIVLTLVIKVLTYSGNEAKLRELLGDSTYQTIINVANLVDLDYQTIAWYRTEIADTDTVINAINESDMFATGYGRYWTREKAEYVDSHLDDCINSLIHLLGIELRGSAGEIFRVENLTDVLNSLVGTSLYTKANADKIKVKVVELISKIKDLEGYEYIYDVVYELLGVDLYAYDVYTADHEWTFADGDRAGFTEAILELVRPLQPILKWLLCEEDIALGVNDDSSDLVVLHGGEGYAYGIIPILEALDCSNVMTPAEYYAAAEADGDALITAILTPVFDKLDIVLADPANEIMQLLPRVIYFVNSNGLDTCFKNILHSVYNILKAIEPAVQVDLYEVLGFNLEDITFASLFEMLLSSLESRTGFRFAALAGDALVELTHGRIVSFTSKNGQTAYTMEYANLADRADMITVILRLVLKFIAYEDNAEVLKAMINGTDKINTDAKKYLTAFVDTLKKTIEENPAEHIDIMLGTLYYVFYGVDKAATNADDWLTNYNNDWQFIINLMGKAETDMLRNVGNAFADILDEYLEGIFDRDGLASKGLIKFFQKIIEFFQKLITFFKSLFNVA